MGVMEPLAWGAASVILMVGSSHKSCFSMIEKTTGRDTFILSPLLSDFYQCTGCLFSDLCLSCCFVILLMSLFLFMSDNPLTLTLSDAGISQSALEEALLSNIHHGRSKSCLV